MIKVFFSHLIKVLESKEPGWRHTHVILMDNAPYHRSKDTLRFLEENNVPCIFTGPHSYDAGKYLRSDFHLLFTLAPVELFYAHFKRADIN